MFHTYSIYNNSITRYIQIQRTFTFWCRLLLMAIHQRLKFYQISLVILHIGWDKKNENCSTLTSNWISKAIFRFARMRCFAANFSRILKRKFAQAHMYVRVLALTQPIFFILRQQELIIFSISKTVKKNQSVWKLSLTEIASENL